MDVISMEGCDLLVNVVVVRVWVEVGRSPLVLIR